MWEDGYKRINQVKIIKMVMDSNMSLKNIIIVDNFHMEKEMVKGRWS